MIGETGKNVFSKTKQYTAVFVRDQKNVCGYTELDSVITGTKCVIKNILSYQEHCTFEFKNSVVFELQGPDNKALFIPIEKALQAKELIVFTNPNEAKGMNLLDERTAFLLSLNQFKESSEDHALKYCKLTDPKKGKKMRRSELFIIGGFLFKIKNSRIFNNSGRIKNQQVLSFRFFHPYLQ